MRKKMEFSANSAESKRPVFNLSKKILNVKLYRDPDSQLIFIGFDLITDSCNNFKKLPLNLEQHISITPGFEEKILKQIWEDASEEEKIFLCSSYESGVVIDQKSQIQIPKSSIYYQLPTNPNAALNWIGAFVVYLNQDTNGFCIHFDDYTKDIDDHYFYQGVREVECIETYQTEKDTSRTIHKTLIEAILSLHNDHSSDCYASAFKIIETVYKQYCEDRSQGTNINFIAYLNPHAYLQVKHHDAIKKLLNSAIGKKAHDGGRYSENYTEFDFLRAASFVMTEDGKLSIVDLDKNPAYLKHYAPGKRNEQIFEPELLFLINVLGLVFEKDNFKDNGMIFDADSTRKLLECGIVCVEKTTPEVKNEKYAQHSGGFFSTNKTNKPFDIYSNPDNIFEIKSVLYISKNLPEDTQKQLSKVHSCIQMIRNKNGSDGDSVTGKLDLNTHEVTFILFNGQHGTDTDEVDSENKNVIKLLESLGAKVSKVPYKHAYWSQSHITLPIDKIDNVMKSLTLLEDIPVEPRMVARC